MDEGFEGVVVSEPRPSQSDFCFIINRGEVARGDFVEISSEKRQLIARVVNVYKLNRYFERPESVQQFEKSGVSIEERFPVSEWEYLVAEAKSLGAYEEGVLRRVNVPPAPGARVQRTSEMVLKNFLGFDDDGLELGVLENHGVRVSLSVDRLLQKHLCILAQSGAGKSYLASVLLEELLERDKEKGRVGCVVFDVHGEYVGFGEKQEGFEDYSDRTTVFDASRIRIPVSKMSLTDFSEYSPSMSHVQKRELGSILEDLKEAHRQGRGLFGLKDVIDAVGEKEGVGDGTKKALIAWLYELNALGLFSKVGEPSVEELVKPGRLSIIDFSKVLLMRKKQIILTYFCRKLFSRRRQGRVPPFLLLVEEAHNFAREGASSREVISRSVLETLAREGRKFGASVCLITQRPIQLSTTVLSQCNTHLIMRVTNPYDLDHIGQTSEGIDRASQNAITGLRVGEALIVGEAVNYPIFARVRKRKSSDLKSGKLISEMAKEYEEARQKVEEDVSAFM